jgi:thioredoxin reductase
VEQVNTSRRTFIKKTGAGIALTVMPFTNFKSSNIFQNMEKPKQFDVIIVGGSYSGLAAAMALGRALKHVLVIDNGSPCNKQTPYSHNFITQDGETPGQIAKLAKSQVSKYQTVEFLNATASKGRKMTKGFEIETDKGEIFTAKKLIFATGVKDLMPAISGYSDCWGISVLHCPSCHGYEVKSQKTAILGNGDYGFEFSSLIFNWTKDLILLTNGKSTLTVDQVMKLKQHNIQILENEIEKLLNKNGHLENVLFKNGVRMPLKAIYSNPVFDQHCKIPASLNCEFTSEGYLQVDAFQKTNTKGVFACGDNTTRMRTVANAVAMGTKAGMAASKEIILEEF